MPTIVLHVYRNLVICSYIDRHLCCFYFWGILVNAAIKLSLQMHLQIFAFSFLGYVPRGGIVGSYCNSAAYKDSTSSLTSCASACVYVCAHTCRYTCMWEYTCMSSGLYKHVYDVHGMITLLLSTCVFEKRVSHRPDS